MSTMLVAVLSLSLFQSDPAPAGRADAGKAAWQGNLCRNCHGDNGEGAYGPDLAGRGLSFVQFKHAVRSPWGVMPAYTLRQLGDQTVADIHAYLASLPKAAEPGKWRWQAPPTGSPRGQHLAIVNGCAQCHGPELLNPRGVIGGEASDVDFSYFAKRIYEHTDVYPDGRMGNFSRDRLPEPVLQEIFDFVMDLGLRAPMRAVVELGTPTGGNVTHTLTVENRGIKGKGLTAENVSISVVVPPGFTVVSTTGSGYQGVRRDAQLNADVAVWQVRRVEPAEKQVYALTLSGSGPADGVVKGSAVRWSKPDPRQKHGPKLVVRDARVPEKGDRVNVTLPPRQPAQ